MVGATALGSSTKKWGGIKNVFVPLTSPEGGSVYTPFGGLLMNPWPGQAKAYAADLFEYRTDDNGLNPELYVLKTYEVYSVSGKTVNIVRDGYRHLPYAGLILINSPEEMGGTGEAMTVVSVAKNTIDGQDVWALTLAKAPTTAPVKGDILVESDSDGNMLVKNVNAGLGHDEDFVYDPADMTPGAMDNYEDARYHLSVIFGFLAYTNRMSPIPPCVAKAVNTSRVNGWFKLGSWGSF